MTDYTLRARWIYMNEAERIEFVNKFEWHSAPLITRLPLNNFEFLQREAMTEPDDIEDFKRLVNTIFKYGLPYRSQNQIRLVLIIENQQYLVDEIQDPSAVETIFRNNQPFGAGK